MCFARSVLFLFIQSPQTILKDVPSHGRGGTAVRTKTHRRLSSARFPQMPRVLVDTRDHVWTEFLGGSTKNSAEEITACSWMEPTYSSPVTNYDACDDETLTNAIGGR